MRINEFLLARVDQDQAAAAQNGYPDGPGRDRAAEEFEHRRAVIHRHHDRTITAASTGTFQTVTRCGVCIREFTRPCRALVGLAQADRLHPDYDQAWDPAD